MNEKVIKIREVKNPIVSVIIPTYNEEKYLEKTLVSIRAQTFKGKYEIIVSDGGSRDRTIEIAKKYADKIVVTKKRGIALGRNLGAKYAKGKILLFLDADTVLLPDALNAIYRAMKEKGVVACSIALFLDDIKTNFLYGLHIPIYKMLTEMKLNPVYTKVLACRKDTFEKLGGFNEKLKVAEDIEFGQRLKKEGKIKYITETFGISSSRRFKRFGLTFLGMVDAEIRWMGSYLSFKILKKQFEYPPIR